MPNTIEFFSEPRNWVMNQSKLLAVGVMVGAMALTGCESTPTQTQNVSPVLQQASADAPTLMMQAASNGDIEQIKNLIESGHGVNVETPQGTALSWALNQNRIGAAQYLLSIGADPNLGVKKGGESLLMKMAQKGETQLVKWLLAAGSDVNYLDTNGDSALSRAAYEGHLTTVKALLKVGANVNTAPRGESLLMHIVNNNDLLIAQVLINAGADVNYIDDAGRSALQIAREKGFGDLEMLLMQSGATS